MAPVHCRIILWWTIIKAGNKRPGVGERRGLSLHLDFVQSWLQGRKERGGMAAGRGGERQWNRIVIMSVIAAQGPRGHVALMALEDVLCTATERKKVKRRERGRVGGRGSLPGCLQFSFFTESPLLSLFSSLLLHPFFSSPPRCPPSLLFYSLLSSSLFSPVLLPWQD